MTIKEPENQIKIQPTDMVSGRLYLKLIEDYKEYDKQQKEYISSLESRLSELTDILEETRSGATKKLYEKLERRKQKIVALHQEIKNLKNENDRLLCENIQLKKTL